MTRKRGNRLGFWFFKMALRLFGLKGSYGLLCFVALYYLLFDRKAVLSIEPYIKRRFPESSFWGVYKHAYLVFFSLGKQLIDRYAFLQDESVFDISVNEHSSYKELISNPEKGFIILNSHIGNWQLALKTIRRYKRNVHIVMRPEDNPAVAESLLLNTNDENTRIIYPTEENLGGIIDIINALKNGGIVAMAGDRSYGAEVVGINFMGDTAYFPYSAFKIAAELECPVAVILTPKLALKKYQIDLSNLIFPKYHCKQNKLQQIKPWVQKYADIISAFLEQHPHDCFIFHDVWKNLRFP